MFASNIKVATLDNMKVTCPPKSNMSQVIVLALPLLTISTQLLSIIFTPILHVWKGRAFVKALYIVPVVLISIAISVFIAILSVRLKKVLDGEGLELFEFVALVVALPLIFRFYISKEE